MSDTEPKYLYKSYGSTSALIQNPDGSTREATPEELAAINALYDNALMASFEMPK